MNSFTDIFQAFYLDFKNTVLSPPPPCSPHVLIQALPHQILKSPSMFSTLVGNPDMSAVVYLSGLLFFESTCLLQAESLTDIKILLNCLDSAFSKGSKAIFELREFKGV